MAAIWRTGGFVKIFPIVIYIDHKELGIFVSDLINV